MHFKKFIAAVAVLMFPLCLQAEYAPVFQHLIDENYEALKTKVLDKLHNSRSVLENRELLRLLLAHEEKFYLLSHFESQIIPFFEGGCLPGENGPSPCGEFKNYSFHLLDNTGQTLIVEASKQKILDYKAAAKTSLAQTTAHLGTAIHIINAHGSSNDFFFLLREIEKLKDRTVRETIMIFKVTENMSCKLAESNVLATDDHYELLTVFIKALGNKVSCTSEVINI